MPRLGMVIDLDKCMGCRACTEACKVENNTPQSFFWMHVFRFQHGEYPNTKVTFLPRPCQHCNNAPCVKVCPVGARYKTEEGPVLTDFDRCIGCRYCEVACPYGVNYFNWERPQHNYYLDWQVASIQSRTDGQVPPYKNPLLAQKYGEEKRLTAGGGHFKGVVEKCTFCVQRITNGFDPACVENCPVDALIFGDFDNPESLVSQLLRQKSHWQLLEETGTDPQVHYVGGSPPAADDRQIESPKAR